MGGEVSSGPVGVRQCNCTYGGGYTPPTAPLTMAPIDASLPSEDSNDCVSRGGEGGDGVVLPRAVQPVGPFGAV